MPRDRLVLGGLWAGRFARAGAGAGADLLPIATTRGYQ